MIRETILHESNIDICCMTETWLKDHHDDNTFSMEGYQLLRADRIISNVPGSPGHGGGLLLFVRNELVLVSKDYQICNKDIELLVATVKPNEQRSYYILLVYRPPSGNYKIAIEIIVKLFHP